MKKKHDDFPENADALRRMAEDRVRENAARSQDNRESLSPEETRRTLHALRVHQIQLEMQNEELRRVQGELETARTRYFNLYDLAPVGYCTLDENGLILEANLTAAALLGVDRGALVSQPFSRFILREDQDIYCHHRKRLFGSGESQACDLRMLKLDGAVFWVHLEASASQNDEGARVSRVVLSDITERRRTEAALLASEERFRLAAQCSSDYIYERDMQTGQALFFGDIDSHLGYTPGGFPRTLDGWMEHIHPEDLSRVMEAIQRSVQHGKPYKLEYRLRRADGTYADWLDRGLLLSDAAANPTKNIGAATDITERKRAEEALREAVGDLVRSNKELQVSRESEAARGAELQAVLDTMDVAVFITRDPEGREMKGNRATENLLRVPPGANVSKGAPLDERPDTFVVMRNGMEISPEALPVQVAARERVLVRDYEFDMVYSDGSVRHLIGNATPLAAGGSVGAFVDITERKRAEMALTEHQKQLQSLAWELMQTEDRERRRIAAYLHDEVSQALAAVRVKFAVWKGMKSSPKRRDLLSDIERLIDGTIEETRTLTFELSPPTLHVLGLGPALERLGEELCGKEGIAFTFLDDGRGSRLDEALASTLYRIARELLLNVVKHAHAKRVSVSVSGDERHIRLVVEDDGIGMAQFRHEQALQGLGETYGLFSIGERVLQMGGSLEMESRLGEGTRVTVLSPRRVQHTRRSEDLA